MGDEYTYTRVAIIGKPDVDLRKEEFSDITFGEYIQNYEQLPDKGGIFCIKLRKDSPEAIGIVNIFYNNEQKDVKICCRSEDIVYIGKSSNILNRVGRMFSSRKSSNMVARKLNRLLPEKNAKNKKRNIEADIGKPMPNITLKRAKDLLDFVEFAYFLEKDLVKRDFKKVRAVNEYMPCLNIGFEH